MKHELKNSVVVLTGASSGIGLECARLFARAGARLVLSARREDRLRALAKELAPTECLVVPADLSSPSHAEFLIQQAVERFGRIDILINNAGYGQIDPIESIDTDDLVRIFNVNFFAPYLAIQKVLPVMRRQHRGHILNIASLVGHRGIPLYSAYCASKGALVRMTESLRVELKGTGIDVSLICPGITLTEFSAATISRHQLDSRTPARGMSARAVARAVLKTVLRPRSEVNLTAGGRALMWMNWLFPSLVDRALLTYRNQVLHAAHAQRKSD